VILVGVADGFETSQEYPGDINILWENSGDPGDLGNIYIFWENSGVLGDIYISWSVRCLQSLSWFC
jgi:hypothetical protein